MTEDKPINIYSTHPEEEIAGPPGIDPPASQELEYLVRDNPDLAAYLQSGGSEEEKRALMREVELAIEEGQAAARANPKIPEEQLRTTNPALYSLALSAYKREETMQYKDPAEEKQKREESKKEMMQAISGMVFGLAGAAALLSGDEKEKEKEKRGMSAKAGTGLGLGPGSLAALGISLSHANPASHSVHDQHAIHQHRREPEGRGRSKDDDKG